MSRLVAPPFSNVEDARRFYFLLMVFLRELKRPGEPVSLYQYLLAQAMHRHRPANRNLECTSCGPPYPCATVLSVALVSKFPAPWAPQALAGSLHAAGLLDTHFVRDDAVAWGGGDPGFSLSRSADGTWNCEERQRSDISTYSIGDDAACCAFLAKMVHENPAGLGWKVTEDDLDLIRPGIGATRAWWLAQSSYPYLRARLGDGEQASWSGLEPGELPDPFVRLTSGDAAVAVQNAARVIPPEHELYDEWLQGLARCEGCYQVLLFSFWTRFALIRLDQTRYREEAPNPATETFASYTEVHAAMQRHGQSCIRISGAIDR